MTALLVLAVLVTPLVVVGYPPAGPLAIIVTVGLYLTQRRSAMIRAQKARARARAEERQRRALIRAYRSLR